MRDGTGRELNYLRLAVTDRCNLRCFYCSPPGSIHRLPRSGILTYEEMRRLVALLAQHRINKVRLTGGEPLIRKGVLNFASELSAIPGIKILAMTTNGTSLAKRLPEIVAAGIRFLNVSLDTLDRSQFEKITGRDELPAVLDGLDAALSTGLHLKINTVVLRGINEDQILPLARLAETSPLQVRFIERMPLGPAGQQTDSFVTSSEIIERLQSSFDIKPEGSGPGISVRYSVEGFEGGLAVIAPLTMHFCGHCNRLRLTPDGHLKTCLLADNEVDLRSPLRSGCTDAELLELIAGAVESKLDQHPLLENGRLGPRKRGMRQIGG